MRVAHQTLEHDLPPIEALLAATLALMTGYSQALQAATNPAQRLPIGAKIAANLAVLAEHPLLSNGFNQVMANLLQCWTAMRECTEFAALDCLGEARVAEPPSATPVCRSAPSGRLH